MIKIENVILSSSEQMEFIIQGMRNPKNSWEKSDSGTCLESLPCHSCHENRNNCKKNIDAGFVLGENDHSLMQQLSNAGTEHRKYMRMMSVYARITAPLYWWKEADTYKIGTVSNSCSTMHKIADKEFTLDDFSYEHLMKVPEGSWFSPLNVLEITIHTLNIYRKLYLGTPSPDGSIGILENRKDIWWQMIQLLPSSYNQTRNVMFNYEVLANIYRQRQNHKLDEWIKFCNWIKTLPHSELITGKRE
jgi:hypothetical protein